MNKETKQQIAAALESYLQQHGMSAAQFASLADIGENYLSAIRNGSEIVKAGGGKEVVIADKYYRQIAQTIGLQLDKNYWPVRPTVQMSQMLGTLEDAKRYGYTNIVIGQTGCGKSHTLDLFIRQSPLDSFKVTVGSTDTIADLLDKMLDALKLPQGKSKSKKIGDVIKKLRDMRRDGLQPFFAFDEAEYMKQATLCNMKELHDHLNGHCGLILVGTDQLVTKLDKLRKKNRDGIPQFYRRIKFGIRTLRAIDTTFKPFTAEIEDKKLVKFLQMNCENYGELHDVLVPAMREADRTGEPLTENFVRKVLNMPA